MLHAAYDSGQFPDGRIGGASPQHRKWLTVQVEAEVESILFRYVNFRFERGEPERYSREGYDETNDQSAISVAQ